MISLQLINDVRHGYKNFCNSHWALRSVSIIKRQQDLDVNTSLPSLTFLHFNHLADGKFKLPCTSAIYTLPPHLSNSTPRYLPSCHCLAISAHIYSIKEKIDLPSKQKLHSFHRIELAVHNAYRSLQAPAPRPPTLRRWCHLRSASLSARRLIKIQIRDRLCIRTRVVRQLMPATACGTLHFLHHDACHPIQAACTDVPGTVATRARPVQWSHPDGGQRTLFSRTLCK